MSTEVGTLLDVEDIVGHRYTLEVSSPGLDSAACGALPITRRFAGCLARFVLAEPVEGQTHVRGRLQGMEGDDVLVAVGKDQVTKVTGLADLAGPAGSGVLSMAGSSNPVAERSRRSPKSAASTPRW